MKYYKYDEKLLHYIEEYHAHEDEELPSNITEITPPFAKQKEGYILLFKKGEWILAGDYLGKEVIVFNKEDDGQISETAWSVRLNEYHDLNPGTFLHTAEIEAGRTINKQIKCIAGQIRIIEKEGKTEKELAKERIRELKQQLTGSDYKVTKNGEAIAAKLKCPYPAKELHAQREAIREEINKLELKLEKP